MIWARVGKMGHVEGETGWGLSREGYSFRVAETWVVDGDRKMGHWKEKWGVE